MAKHKQSLKKWNRGIPNRPNIEVKRKTRKYSVDSKEGRKKRKKQRKYEKNRKQIAR